MVSPILLYRLTFISGGSGAKCESMATAFPTGGNIGSSGLCPRESEHQPRLISYPMRVELRHLIEQLLVGFRRFLQPIEVLQVTLGILDRRGRVGRASLLVTGDNHRRIQCC